MKTIGDLMTISSRY